MDLKATFLQNYKTFINVRSGFFNVKCQFGDIKRVSFKTKLRQLPY